jgi:hypothetical protein
MLRSRGARGHPAHVTADGAARGVRPAPVSRVCFPRHQVRVAVTGSNRMSRSAPLCLRLHVLTTAVACLLCETAQRSVGRGTKISGTTHQARGRRHRTGVSAGLTVASPSVAGAVPVRGAATSTRPPSAAPSAPSPTVRRRQRRPAHLRRGSKARRVRTSSSALTARRLLAGQSRTAGLRRQHRARPSTALQNVARLPRDASSGRGEKPARPRRAGTAPRAQRAGGQEVGRDQHRQAGL